MSWEYRFLKRELALPADPTLDLFERFSERAYGLMDAMEWSWSFKSGRCRHNRVFWLGAPGHAGATACHLKWLGRELRFEPAGLDGGLPTWHELLDCHTERAAVAYAGADPPENRPAALKLYLTLRPQSASVAQPLLFSLMPRLPHETPLASATIVLCYAVYATGEARSRVYLMYNQQDFDAPEVSRWLAAAAGERALALSRSHVRSGISFKNDTTDMLGLGFRPSDTSLRDHPCWWNSPALDPIFEAAGSRPLLRQRLDRLSWVTVALSPEALALPMSIPEMNVYVKLD